MIGFLRFSWGNFSVFPRIVFHRFHISESSNFHYILPSRFLWKFHVELLVSSSPLAIYSFSIFLCFACCIHQKLQITWIILAHHLFGFFSVEQVVCCCLTPLQVALYELLVRSKAADCQLNDGKVSRGSLDLITQLKKLCNRKYKSRQRGLKLSKMLKSCI